MKEAGHEVSIRLVAVFGAVLFGAATWHVPVRHALCFGAEKGNGGSVRDVAARLLERQRKVRSAHFVWKEARFRPRGSIQDPDGRGAVYPARDTTVEWNVSLFLDGAKVRYNRDGPLWDLDRHEFVSQTFSSISNGETGKTFTKRASDKDPYGCILASPECSEIGNVDLMPLLLCIRGRHEMYARRTLEPDKWIVASAREKVGRFECVVLQRKEGRTSQQYLAFATGDDCPLVQYCIRRRGQVSMLVDVEYSSDVSWGRVPSKWKITYFTDAGTLHWSVSATVVQYAINPNIDQSVFDLDFPEGTIVGDQKSRSEYRVTSRGAKAPLTRARPVPSGNRQPGRIPLLVGVGGISLAVVCALWWAHRRLKVSQGEPESPPRARHS